MPTVDGGAPACRVLPIGAPEHGQNTGPQFREPVAPDEAPGGHDEPFLPAHP
jgi:hypothetical protein